MNWYIAKLIFRIVCGDGNHTHQFDEQLRLIHASSENDALNKAAAIALQEQVSFMNQNNELVQWRFIDIPELYNLSHISDGLEICSRIHETHQYENYIDLVRSKADHIRSRVVGNRVEHV
jgi:hypothetical protein